MGSNAGLINTSRLAAVSEDKVWRAGRARPIQIGDTIRRMAGRGLLRNRRPACEQRALRANNFAFTEDGCSALRKILRLHMAEHSAHICLTSDAVSAFMRAQRHEMTRQLYYDDDESLRPLLSYFFSLYSSHAKIFYGDQTILSSPLRRAAIKVVPLVPCCIFCLLLL